MFTFTIFWRLCKTVIFYSYMFAWIHLENHLGLGFLCRKIFTYDSFILLVLGIFKVFLFLLGLVLVYFLGICLVCLIFPISWYKVAYFLLSSSLSVHFSSVQFSRSVMSDFLRPHELQHARPPCPSPTPVVHPNPCPLTWWCHPTISSSVVPSSSCPQSFQASGSFPMSQLFASGRQTIGVLASTSVPPMNTQDRSPLGWIGWISLQSKGLSRVFSNTTVQKHQFFGTHLSL